MSDDVRIIDYTDNLADRFYAINAEWIEGMFSLEDKDREILLRPREAILDGGGLILFAEAGDLGIIGTCALMNVGGGMFELTKMGVLERARGRKAGERLLESVLERAKSMNVELLYLLTNARCVAAIHLYEKLGFVHDPAILQRYGGAYSRCDVGMRYPSMTQSARQ